MSDTARESGASARSATAADAQAIGQTLARAFADDPLLCFLLRDPARRETNLPRLFRLLFKLGLQHGACEVTSGCESVALWRPPGKWAIHWWEYILNMVEFLGVFGGDARHVTWVMDVIEKNHPHEPHWYLQAIGTDPDKQGKGFGSLVMRPYLAIADQQGLPCYLESSKETNIPIYQSFGFELTGEVKLKDGPVFYPMWRKVRA